MQKANNIAVSATPVSANLNRLAYFVAVVETGSFTAAADRLGITKAVVSQQVARLEKEFRTALLIRSTRRVRTTETGQAFYYRCALILKEAEDAFGQLAATASEPTGTLRLTAPFDYGISMIVPAIAAFTERYPQCKVEAQFSDQMLDLSASHIDLSIRVGWLTEQHLQARLIGRFEQWLVASPQWGKRLRHVTAPEQLSGMPIVANTALRAPTHWTFSRGALDRQSVNMNAALLFNATLAVREAAIAGAGLAVLPDYAADRHLVDGTLVRILPDWQLPRGDIHTVFPSTRYRPANVRAFVDLLCQRLGNATP